MYLSLRRALLAAYQKALSQALPPKERVARHWADPSRLTWLALLSEQTRFQLAWSLGPLKDSSLPGLQTSGVFHLDDAVFPGVGAAAIAREVLATMPETDGPTTAFLIRVVAQLALAEVALTLEEARSFGLPVSDGFAVTLALRADALESKALTPRMPGHAEARVLAALEKMEPALAVTISALLASKELVLLDAVRALPATHH
jgi:hypothetical protein